MRIVESMSIMKMSINNNNVQQSKLFLLIIVIYLSFQPLILNAMNFTVEPIQITDISDLGEGPYWNDDNQQLYYVDAFAGYIHRYCPQLNLDEKINLGDLVTIIISIDNNTNHFIVSLRNKIVNFDWINKTFDVIAECAAEHGGKERFNDGKVDAAGRLWIGTVLEGSDGVVKSGGSLYRLDMNEKKFIKMSENFTISNGMAWNHNNTLMYLNDSEDRKIWLFDFNLNTGTINNRRIFIDLDDNQHSNSFKSDEYPDGMTIDSNDYLWISMYNGGRIVRIDPQTKQVILSIPVPALRTTSLTFGGKNFDEIYVTTGSNSNQTDTKNEQEKYPTAGKIFKIKFINNEQIKGLKAFQFKF
uniref:Regucalcin-like n=1 Tax=Dermatophagoides pteronyssinus TaxID=6956 RepID=A0A6P6XU80_DERPT|nr:regucalcin-like [Dermatophagoides pteronyssinus]